MKTEEDYYFNEAGLMVMTAEFHLKRGFCCGSGCFHCPFENNKEKNKTKNER